MAATDDLNRDAVHATLVRALAPPALPDGFRQRLVAALAREPGEALARRRLALERERREQLAALARDSVRLKLQTLGALVGGAFVAGVATALALPWIHATFAPHEALALVVIGAVIAAAAGLLVLATRAGETDWTQ
jgi:hypothetical protein